MDYKKFGNSLYIRFDKADEIVSGIMAICEIRKQHFGAFGFQMQKRSINDFLQNSRKKFTRKIFINQIMKLYSCHPLSELLPNLF